MASSSGVPKSGFDLDSVLDSESLEGKVSNDFSETITEMPNFEDNLSENGFIGFDIAFQRFRYQFQNNRNMSMY